MTIAIAVTVVIVAKVKVTNAVKNTVISPDLLVWKLGEIRVFFTV